MHLKRASRVRGADGPAEGGQKAGGRVWMGRPRCLQNSRSSLEAVHPEEVRDRSARSLPRHGLRRTVQTSPRGSQEDCAAGISLRGTSPPAWAKGLCKLLVAALTAGRRASTLAAPSTPAAWALLGVPVGMATGVGRAGSQEEINYKREMIRLDLEGRACWESPVLCERPQSNAAGATRCRAGRRQSTEEGDDIMMNGQFADLQS
ncbi:uncharacterized protein LOC115296251 isoform X1 [Suricata suricatta]|uniref:uncharacterized protein LOC115296251 isoform X1 n=1 Tax=Suricata suricatta TaxID=37032 RepID=UPI001155EC31|nr:uncharacterized protein LOC115296251 isoform X1 [Suricata suricatta]